MVQGDCLSISWYRAYEGVVHGIQALCAGVVHGIQALCTGVVHDIQALCAGVVHGIQALCACVRGMSTCKCQVYVHACTGPCVYNCICMRVMCACTACTIVTGRPEIHPHP